MYKRLRDEIGSISSDVVRFTQDLIRIPSPRLHEKELARKVESEMRSLCYDLVFTDDVGNIVGVVRGNDPGHTVVACSHMDTVKPEGIERWIRSPFSGDIADGRIEGVGAAECKAGLAAQIYAGQVVAASRVLARGTLVVAATVAEENGCGIGLRHLLGTTLSDLGMDPSFVLVGEPTGLAIGTGHDGWVAVDVEARSPVQGVAQSAGEHIFQILTACCEDGAFDRPCAIMTIDPPRTDWSDEQYRVSVRLYRRLFPGESGNDVVDWLVGPVLRTAREMHTAVVHVGVHEELQHLYTGHIRLVRFSVPPWSADLSHPMVGLARQAMVAGGCGWAPASWKLEHLGIGTAGAVVDQEFGIPVIGYGPGDEAQVHAANESVSLHALVDAVYGTATLMHGLNAARLGLPFDVMRVRNGRHAERTTGGRRV